MPELVIFDCDGVLVDSEPISMRVGTAVLAELGWQLTEQEFAERFVGCSAEYFHREVEAWLGRPLEPGWEARYVGRYRAAFTADLRAVSGVTAALDEISERGVMACVASNSGHDHIAHVLEVTGLRDRFPGRVFSAEDVGVGKPAPDLFLHAAAALGTAPDRCVVVEDSPSGVQAAVAAGMRCLAYAGPFVTHHRLTELGATVFHRMLDLVGLLGLGRDQTVAEFLPEPVDNTHQIENALTNRVRTFSPTPPDPTAHRGPLMTQTPSPAPEGTRSR